MNEALKIFSGYFSNPNVKENEVKPLIIKEVKGNTKSKSLNSRFLTCNTYKELLVEFPEGQRVYMSRAEFNKL